MVVDRSAAVLLVSLAACSGKLEPQEGVALEGFRYGWKGFNHRVSALELGLGTASAKVAVVGGTSTTGVVPPPLPEGCESDACKEFPVPDSSDVVLDWARLTSAETAIVAGTVALEVGRAGTTGVVSVPLPKGAVGEPVALISGVHLSTDHPVSGGDSCYNPAYGWHPRSVSVTLGVAQVVDDALEVSVDATFEAGESLEADRVCIDEVNDQAVVELVIDVLFLVGEGDQSTAAVSQGAEFPYDGGVPDVQVDPAPLALSLGFTPTAVGFSSLSYAFHVDDPEERGAYLRTLAFSVDAVEGTANGTATNYSPGTQLSGFDYAFEGEVQAVSFPLTAERGTISATLPADLDDAGAPVLNDLPY
jgi:hypothetical protein